MASHTLNLSLESRASDVDGKNMIFIRYTYLGKHKRKMTEYRVFKNHWDTKVGMIASEHQEHYPQQMIDDLYSMKMQFNPLRIALREKSINYTTAFDKLLKRGSEEVDLKKFVLTSPKCKKFTPKTKQKLISFIKAIEKKLKQAKHHFTVLTTDIIVDEVYCNEINEILRESNISTNTRRDYLQKLDAISRQTDHLKNSVFKSEGLYPKLVDTSRDPVEFDALMEGINDIRTLQDLEAYLFWLYSFCLLGLDVNDIVNLDESTVAINGEKITGPYHPDALFDDMLSKYGEKTHLKFFRKKSKVPMTICINLMPILFIRDWLHYLVKINRTQYAYKGTDRLRIFNFKTLTPTGNDDMEGEAKKKAIADTYRQKTQRMFRGTLQQTRHTVTAQGQENGMSNSELDGQLGHSAKGSLRHYLKTHQIPKDVNHIHIIEEFGILKIMRSLILKVHRMTELVNSEDVRFTFWQEYKYKLDHNKTEQDFLMFEDMGWDVEKMVDSIANSNVKVFILPKNEADLRTIQIINGGKLTHWSAEDEKRMQTLMAKESRGKWEMVNGVNTKVEVSTEMFSDELKELVAKKENVFVEMADKAQKAIKERKLAKKPSVESKRLI